MKILAISDTHGFHEDLNHIKNENIDMIIHAGDISNRRDIEYNANECINFLEWYNSLDIKYKILIAGNHDGSIQNRMIDFTKYDTITYLEHNSVNIEGINIFGSPYTPTFGNWYFMKNRHKLDSYWEYIPEETDILVTHGPPKGILDLVRNDYTGDYDCVGDKSLLNHVMRVNPKFHIFGHIHNNDDCINKGTRKLYNLETTFINASAVTDRKFNMGLTSLGIYFEI